MKKNILVLALLLLVSTVFAEEHEYEKPNLNKKFTDAILKNYDKTEVDTEKLRENKLLLIKFGATWCRGCNTQTSIFKEVYENTDKDKIAILEVFYREKNVTVELYVNNKELKHFTAIDKRGTYFSEFEITDIPKVLIVDQNGIIQFENDISYYEDIMEQYKKLTDSNEKAVKFRDFKAIDLENRKIFNSKDFRKNEITIINFASTWDKKSQKQITHLNKVANEFKNQVKVLHVNSHDGSLSEILKYKKDNKIDYKIVMDYKNRLMNRFKISKLPTVLIINSKGEISYRGSLTNYETLKNQIKSLLIK